MPDWRIILLYEIGIIVVLVAIIVAGYWDDLTKGPPSGRV